MSLVEDHGYWKNISKRDKDAAGLAVDEARTHDKGMTEMNREEVKARLGESEAKVASALDGMRVENSTMKSDILTAIAAIRTDHAKDQVVSTRWAVGVLFSILLAASGTIVTIIVRTASMHPDVASNINERTQQPSPIVIQVPYPIQAPSPASSTRK